MWIGLGNLHFLIVLLPRRVFMENFGEHRVLKMDRVRCHVAKEVLWMSEYSHGCSPKRRVSSIESQI